ncbi:TadE/TadG family type IV pilus assembly protein [[Haemophilus] ducreyi]|uniref:TadE/TadG family type IV pilus assembly protein n=1 Tax=Haemophilus ducreyi TaxID=730 RepID=UPI000A77729D
MRKYVITQTKRFIQNQSGVYIIFGALLTLPIVALLFVSLEVAGIIQDKARLNDALEQAVLSLTAENNSGRKSYDYALTNAEKANGKYLADSEAGKRDSQIVKTFVKLYLPQIDENTMKFEPICTTQNNAITPKNGKQYAYSSSHVTCTVTGSINHRSLFPMTVGKSKIIPEQVSLSSGSMAQKINNVNLPQETGI